MSSDAGADALADYTRGGAENGHYWAEFDTLGKDEWLAYKAAYLAAQHQLVLADMVSVNGARLRLRTALEDASDAMYGLTIEDMASFEHVAFWHDKEYAARALVLPWEIAVDLFRVLGLMDDGTETGAYSEMVRRKKAQP